MLKTVSKTSKTTTKQHIAILESTPTDKEHECTNCARETKIIDAGFLRTNFSVILQ